MAASKKGKTDAKSQGKGDAAKGGKGKAGKGAVLGEVKNQKETKQKGAQSIWVRHILCDKHSKKEEALAKLREGVSFAEVAKEFSEDKAKQGGNLGRKVKGTLLPEFEEVAYALPALGKGSEKEYPFGEVKSSEGYHIILVEKRE